MLTGRKYGEGISGTLITLSDAHWTGRPGNLSREREKVPGLGGPNAHGDGIVPGQRLVPSRGVPCASLTLLRGNRSIDTA
jgi:hypothetical protein